MTVSVSLRPCFGIISAQFGAVSALLRQFFGTTSAPFGGISAPLRWRFGIVLASVFFYRAARNWHSTRVGNSLDPSRTHLPPIANQTTAHLPEQTTKKTKPRREPDDRFHTELVPGVKFALDFPEEHAAVPRGLNVHLRYFGADAAPGGAAGVRELLR